MNIDIRNFDHWQDWGNLLLALWLCGSPWLFGYSSIPSAAWTAFVVAIIVAVFSAAALLQYARWEEWINALVGLWLIVSPWAMGYSATTAALWNHVAVGVLIVLLSGWELAATAESASG